ncbi:MAG: ATP-binding region atpase domain protein [Frankiales bacterium]|nr:ATP-binding region atpase domain protein [Frankiales bacterium]
MLLHPASSDGVDVLSVTGPVLADEVDSLVRAVEQAWSRFPRAVVLDLRGVTSLASEVVAALTGLSERSRPWPHPSLLLCCLPVGTAVPGVTVHDDRDQALQHVDDRSPAPRERLPLPHGPQGPGRAREIVAAWVERFGLQELGDDLELVVSEMVTNAVRHAAAPVSLEVEADGRQVLVAVNDGSPDAPTARGADADAEGGRGLLLVDLLSAEHGVRPDPPGKTVWAALVDPGHRA